MALFGSNNRKRLPYDTSGFGDGARGTGMAAPEENPTFWQGGSKFGVRDGIAGALAALGDVFSQRGGGQGGAVQMLAGSRIGGIDAMRQAQAKAAETAAMQQRYAAAGLSGPQADLAASGGMAKPSYGDLNPQPTTEMQNFNAYRGMDGPTRQQYGQYQDMTHPTITNGYGSTMIPRASMPGAGAGLPHGYDPSEWELTDVPAGQMGGGAGNGVGGFPGSIPSGNPLYPYRR